ncbi:winged helix-turn-helix transcriptional regulator [Paraburkholderia sp. 22B1P]|uniref:winged helix-turn-helix transcriptional regulator n=1 Tax=Paraburkholderia sp. 22B1P TaxID=3080498 RepID=UPI00308CE7EF|nr:winged helix-turn-helix domain-containing protein [Paraburkholderia sp. 22B1P]
MSLIHEQICWTFELPGLKKIVLLSLARNAHRHSLEGFIGHQKLAHECGISESAARKYVHELEADGYITRIRVPTRGVQYRLNSERISA